MMNTFKILTNLGRIQKFLKISTVHTITLIFNCLAVLLYLHNVPPVPLSTLLKNPFSQSHQTHQLAIPIMYSLTT